MNMGLPKKSRPFSTWSKRAPDILTLAPEYSS